MSHGCVLNWTGALSDKKGVAVYTETVTDQAKLQTHQRQHA